MYNSTSNSWVVIENDGSWNTKYTWRRHINLLLFESYATIYWNIPKDTIAGKYKIVHYGNAKDIFSRKIYEFKGESSQFTVVGKGRK